SLGVQHRESGLAARLLLACPPRRAKRWTEADIDPRFEEAFADILDRLYELQPATSEDGALRPVALTLTPDAKRIWKTYYNAHNEEQVDVVGDLPAAYSKLEESAARLALVIPFCRWAAGDPTLESPEMVDAVSMEAGVKLAQWFKHEARRVYALLEESDDQR